MMKKPLCEHLADYYVDKALRPSTAERLERMAETVERRPRRPRRMLFSSVAASVLGVLLVMLGAWGLPPLLRGTDRTRQVAQEIVVNYEKNLGPEILTDDFGDLAAMGERLGFVPSEPARMATDGFRLVGARYCSVQRHAAAQMTLTDQSRQRTLLYQLLDAHDLPDFEPTVVSVDDLTVTMWREGAFFYGLITPSE